MIRIPSSVHVRLENGLALRKTVLEAALISAGLLQKFKFYQKESAEKKKVINKFKEEINAVSEMLHELEIKDLPQGVIKKQEAPEVKSLKEIRREIEKKMEEPIEKSGLELELENLREKINSIKV